MSIIGIGNEIIEMKKNIDSHIEAKTYEEVKELFKDEIRYEYERLVLSNREIGYVINIREDVFIDKYKVHKKLIKRLEQELIENGLYVEGTATLSEPDRIGVFIKDIKNLDLYI